MYTVRHKLKHRLNSFLENEGSFPVVLFMKIDEVATICSKFRFDYQPGMINAHFTLKLSLFSNPLSRVGISGTTAKSRKPKSVPSSHPGPFAVVASSRKSQT